MAKDSSFDKTAYYPEVFSAGVINDKRYFIPLSYDIPTLISSKSALGTLGLSIGESGWTISDLRAAVAKYKASNPSSGQYFFDSSMTFRMLVRLCGIQLIDYQNQTTHFQSREFIDLLTLYKEMNPLIMTPEIEMNLDFPPILLKNRTIMMSVLRGQSPEQLYMTNSIYKGELKDDFVILPFPTIEAGAKYPIQLYDVVSVNAKCNNKQAAFDFIKILLSEDIQRAKDSHGNSNITYGLPINKNAFLKDLEEMKKPVDSMGTINYGNGIKTLSVTPVPLTDDLADQAVRLNNQMGSLNYLDKEVENIINEGLQAFLTGKRTAEQAAKEIDEKVTLFLNE